MGKLFYNLGLLSYSSAIHLASPFKEKAKLFVQGRKHQDIKSHEGCIWFHCASLGEFEQARPIIEGIKENNSKQEIVITFFSPSGYEIRKDYRLADAIYYLPLDRASNAKRFLDQLQPKAAIFIKYEVWHYYFKELKQRKIPLYLVSATFRENQIYFKPQGKFLKNTLMLCDHIFTQDQASLDLLAAHGFNQITLAGDTRFDRVMAQSKQANRNQKIAGFKGNDLLIIVGSSWPLEEKLLSTFIKNNSLSGVKFLIAPHDISENHVEAILAQFNGSIRYQSEENQETDVLILDTIGHLASAFSHADIAIIGGGFTNALHNILEPATFGLPVIYGDNHEKYPEGNELMNSGGGFSVSQEKFDQILNDLISDVSKRQAAGKASSKFIQERIGATELLFEKIPELS
jgi:3-deoxy-D-manno-octulosonic-acid transferase